jgi:hypothetical protein
MALSSLFFSLFNLTSLSVSPIVKKIPHVPANDDKCVSERGAL